LADKPDYQKVAPCDALRTPEHATQADTRSEGIALVDAKGIRPVTLADRYEDIQSFELNLAVPHSIRVHFETAKNVYLYSWFVYRFFPVAEQQALTSLEFALRERLPPPANTRKGKPKREGLSDRLTRARDLGLIRNESLQIRGRMAMRIARERFKFEALEEMVRTGATEMILDESKVQPSEEDLSHDWIGALIKSLPEIRNDYAHGSNRLHSTILLTFEIVSDLINQLYPNESYANSLQRGIKA
jgi:hypothetical protein